MSATKDIPKVKRYYDGWADQNSKDKITWEEAWSEHCPNPDVAPYVADEAVFQELKNKFASRDVTMSFHCRELWIQTVKKYSDEYKAYRDKKKDVEIDLMSMAVGGDVGCPVETMGPRFIHTDPKYNAATSPEEIQKKMDDYVNAMR